MRVTHSVRRAVAALRAKLKTWARYHRVRRDVYLDPDRLLYLPPESIRWIARPDGLQDTRLLSPVIGGDWDLNAQPVDAYGFHDDLTAVARGGSWEDTRVWRDAVEKFESGDVWNDGIADRAAFDERFAKQYDGLLDSISRLGYLSRRELLAGPGSGASRPDPDVELAVGRDGRRLVFEGRHRVACATVLGVPVIPCTVAFRHPAWMVVRERLAQAAEAHGGRLPEPAGHPDLDNMPSDGTVEALFDCVRSALPADPVRLLDICPGWGYLCHRFAGSGTACTAVLSSGPDDWFLRTLREVRGVPFELLAQEDLPTRPDAYDVVVATGNTRSPSRHRREALSSLLIKVVERGATAHLFLGSECGGAHHDTSSRGLPPSQTLDRLAAAGGFTFRETLHAGDGGLQIVHLAKR
jgi:hypothetical protein